METGTTGAARPVGRRRRAGASDVPHTCPYCGRTFKRSEHKERHVRTHTKEKPFICRCGAAFARRDLLTRHQRIVSHEKHDRLAKLSKSSPEADSEQTNAPVEADMAAAVSLSGMSMNPWEHQARQPPDMYPANGHAIEVPPQALPQPFQQPIMSQEFFDHSPDSAGLEFSNFFDGVGLPAEWSPDYQPQEPEEEELLDPQLRESVGPSGQAGLPFGCWMPPTPQENRIPELPIN